MYNVTRKLSRSNGIGANRIPKTSFDTINLDVFKNTTSKCKPPNDINGLLTESCCPLKRLCASSLYFDALTSSKMDAEVAKGIFVEFNESVYRQLVDDTKHLIKEHSNDLKRVHVEWTQKYGAPNCSVSFCAKTGRQYGRNRSNGDNGKKTGSKDSALYSFYEGLYDRVHNFVCHLYDIGMRVDEAALLEDVGGDQKEEDLEGLTVDKRFEAERDCVRTRREQTELDLDRFESENNKFTMKSAEAKGTGTTLMDALFERLVRNEKVDRETLRRLTVYLVQNGYDSEGIEMDLYDAMDSNIYAVLQDQLAMDWMNDFIRNVNCMYFQ